ncbi:MAG: hypothetical protein WCW25_02125 [Patescibacteria group bacterium]
MGNFDNLPKAGAGFRISGTPGSFQRKFRSAIKYGDLKNLKDNEAAITKEFENRMPALRKRGGLTWQERRSAYFSILKRDKKLTFGDKKEVKKLLESYAKGQNSSGGGILKGSQTAEKKSSSGSFWGILGSKKKEEKPPVNPAIRAYDPEAMATAGRVGYNPDQRGFAGSGTGSVSSQEMSGSMKFINNQPNRYAKKGTGNPASLFALGGKSGASSASQGKALGPNRLKPII